MNKAAAENRRMAYCAQCELYFCERCLEKEKLCFCGYSPIYITYESEYLHVQSRDFHEHQIISAVCVKANRCAISQSSIVTISNMGQ